MAALAVACVLLFTYWAPFQFASMAAYTRLVLVLAGGLCTLFPFRFLGVHKRRTGAAVLLAGLLLTTGAILFPAPLVQVERRSTQLDEVMPGYHFFERHTQRIHAPAPQVMAAILQTTSAELPATAALMRIRGAVMRQHFPETAAMRRMSILDELTAPGSGFVVLYRDDREIVLGMAGQPWAGPESPQIKDATQYAAFQLPGSVKVAVNLRVDDVGTAGLSLRPIHAYSAPMMLAVEQWRATGVSLSLAAD
jgi:hypothetical protein